MIGDVSVGTHMQEQSEIPWWTLVQRIAFRFCFVYLGLFSLTTQILPSLIPVVNVEIADPAELWPIRHIVFWTAAHVFGVTQPLVYQGSGSGDKTFDWVLAFCLLVAAVWATGIWSVLDRRRVSYTKLYVWFRVFMRFALASQMFVYGMSKAVPLQMPFPHLARLLEPFGRFSPMGVLWYSIGASPAYEIFAGCAEMLGGILLIVPCTSMLGALVCLADMTQVFALNMTYDVPVKLFSFHLILMTLFLLAPDARRLADFFRHRAVEAAREPRLFRSRRANAAALAAQIVFGIGLIGANVFSSWSSWHTYGGARPKSLLYGIWDVERMSIDGQLRAPLLTDRDRWRRAIFDSPDRLVFERADDSYVGYGAAIDANHKTIALTKTSDKKWRASFTFARPANERLTLDGEMDGHTIRVGLRLFDRDQLTLVSRGFHWIQEYPFNR